MSSFFGKVANYIATAASGLPFEIKEEVPEYGRMTIWKLHHGRDKSNSEPLSIFIFNKQEYPEQIPVAQNALKRSKTVRHPGFVKLIYGEETDKLIYIATEPVRPLTAEFENVQANTDGLTWGLYQITRAISFLNHEAGLIHGCINNFSVFIDRGGDWKVGAMDFVTSPSDPVAYELFSKYPETVKRYLPPEMQRTGGRLSTESPIWGVDIWGLGCLVWECFNGILDDPRRMRDTSRITQQLRPKYIEMCSANPNSRPDPRQLLQSQTSPGGFFQNDFVRTNLFLEELTVKDHAEKLRFFRDLENKLDTFPKEFNKYKILPQLLLVTEYGDDAMAVFPMVVSIGKDLTEEEYTKRILPSLLKLFQQNERVVRLNLLNNLPSYVDHLPDKLVNDTIFPTILNGFNDTAPIMREATLRSMIPLAPKLNEKNVTQQLMRYFAKLQLDNEPGIRTNVTVCLSKIAPSLSAHVREKVLIAAFLRALKDTFPPARVAALKALQKCTDFYSTQDFVTRVIPGVAPILLDPSKDVRDLAFALMRDGLKAAEEQAKTLGTVALSVDPAQPNSVHGSSNASAGSGGWFGSYLDGAKKYIPKSVLERSGLDNSNQQQLNQPLSAKPADNKPAGAPAAASTATGSAPGGGASNDVFLSGQQKESGTRGALHQPLQPAGGTGGMKLGSRGSGGSSNSFGFGNPAAATSSDPIADALARKFGAMDGGASATGGSGGWESNKDEDWAGINDTPKQQAAASMAPKPTPKPMQQQQQQKKPMTMNQMAAQQKQSKGMPMNMMGGGGMQQPMQPTQMASSGGGFGQQQQPMKPSAWDSWGNTGGSSMPNTSMGMNMNTMGGGGGTNTAPNNPWANMSNTGSGSGMNAAFSSHKKSQKDDPWDLLK
eukprot:Clim_evm49s22 gene=Clim_evmTU49s22